MMFSWLRGTAASSEVPKYAELEEKLTRFANDILQELSKARLPDRLAIEQFVDRLLSLPRYQEPLRLLRHGYKVYSQNDEDGIIAEIFRRIGAGNRIFVEFGVERGIECNTLWLLMQDWKGLWIEGNEAHCNDIKVSHGEWIQSGALSVRNAMVTADNINELIGNRHSGPIDLLSIDIDHNDYYVWKAIEVVAPRVVCIEYNAAWRPPVSVSVAYDPGGTWNGTNYVGVSLSALVKLGREKGYKLVGCCLAGVNAFFVKDELCKDLFIASGEAAEHYEPARYFLLQPAGHAAGLGPLTFI